MTDALGPAAFQGAWTISRTIDDHLSGRPGTFTGTAWLTATETGLRYDESGHLSFPRQPPLLATRAYLWTWDADGGVVVTFEDGRPFHGFRPEGRSTGIEHPCGADLYVVDYDFTAWPLWQATWRVRGPRKDYTMTSCWRREGP